MKSLVVLMTLGLVAQGLKTQTRIQKLAESLSRAQQASTTHSCSTAINRWKNEVPTNITAVIGTGVSFTDANFPVNDALYWQDYSLGKFASIPTAIKFDRARARLTNTTIINTVDVSDIRQGGLGDCYFMCSCAAAGEFEKRLSDAFITKTYNAEGIIGINAYVLGIKKQITMDDYLPFYNRTDGYSKLLYFAQPSPTNELWGPFLEKAWAKVSGNYEVTEGGWPTEAMRFLTGSPSQSFSISSFAAATAANSVFNIVSDADIKQLIITAGTPSATSDQVNNAVGLAMSHAYSIIGAVTLKNTDGTTKARLFKIRNPWGSDGAYFGAYSDKDAIWNITSYATQVNFVNANDGIFYITAEDFVKYFSSFIISYYREGWQFSTSTVWSDDGNWKRFDFTLATAQEGYIGVDFYTNRMYPKGCRTSYTKGSLRVFGNGRLVDSITDWDIDYFSFITNGTFQAGTYSVYFKPQWQTNDVRDYTVRAYFPTTVTFTRVDYTTDAAAQTEMAKSNQATLSLRDYLVAASADTTTAYNAITQTNGVSKFGWYGSSPYGLIFWKVTPLSTTQKCTFTVKVIAPQSGVASDIGACTTTFDATSLKQVHTCVCALGALGGIGAQSCNMIFQISGLSSYSYSYYNPTSTCVAA